MENIEFEQMRSQMAALEKKIAGQEIINDRLMRESMKDKMAWIKKYIIGEIALVPVIAILYVGISIFADLPMWFALIIILGCVIDIYFDWKVNVTPLRDNDFDRQNLIDTAEKLRKMKTIRYRQTIIGIVFFLLLMLAIAVYVYFAKIRGGQIFDFSSTYNSIFVGGCVGFAIGTAIGVAAAWKIFRKMQRSNDAAIKQIEELTSEA